MQQALIRKQEPVMVSPLLEMDPSALALGSRTWCAVSPADEQWVMAEQETKEWLRQRSELVTQQWNEF